MNIEIGGIGFPNKGAELLLAAIIEALRDRLPNVKFVLPTTETYGQRRRAGCWQKLWRGARGAQWGYLTEFVPQKLLRPLGVVRDSEIDVYLDASGYAYGDPWGVDKAEQRLGRYCTKWRRGGRKIVLLPQAFGPFTSTKLISVMQEVLSSADRVYARDELSLAEVEKIIGADRRLSYCPDITVDFPGVTLERNQEWRDWACFIPNVKVLEKGGVDHASYIELMAGLIDRLNSVGIKSFVLLHEGAKDEEICNRIVSHARGHVPLVKREDPQEIKGLIGGAHLVVSSRFHGFMSALSQGVPAFATSWSHKYDLLAREYVGPELILSGGIDAAWQQIWDLVGGAHRAALQSRIKKVAVEQKKMVSTMWAEVINVINNR